MFFLNYNTQKSNTYMLYTMMILQQNNQIYTIKIHTYFLIFNDSSFQFYFVLNFKFLNSFFSIKPGAIGQFLILLFFLFYFVFLINFRYYFFLVTLIQPIVFTSTTILFFLSSL